MLLIHRGAGAKTGLTAGSLFVVFSEKRDSISGSHMFMHLCCTHVSMLFKPFVLAQTRLSAFAAPPESMSGNTEEGLDHRL